MSANLSEPQRNAAHASVRGIGHLGHLGLRRALPVMALLTLLVLAWPLLAQEYRLRGAALALSRAEQGDLAQAEQATALFRHAVAANPKDATLRQRLARAYSLAGDAEAALVELEQAWRLRPESTLSQQELALAYERAGQLDRADTLWRGLGLRAPQMRSLADIYAQAGDEAAAAAWRERAERAD